MKRYTEALMEVVSAVSYMWYGMLASCRQTCYTRCSSSDVFPFCG